MKRPPKSLITTAKILKRHATASASRTFERYADAPRRTHAGARLVVSQANVRGIVQQGRESRRCNLHDRLRAEDELQKPKGEGEALKKAIRRVAGSLFFNTGRR
jgi:hypothetical protein